jgi:hypothetical protein
MLSCAPESLIAVATAMRQAEISRKTLETEITVRLNLDGSGQSKLATGVPFLEHMLDQVARHGMIDLEVEARGDLHIDAHHTVEDVGITLGQALAKAVGDKKGIRRYGHAYVPLDEALSRVVVDFSGRPGLTFNVDFSRAHDRRVRRGPHPGILPGPGQSRPVSRCTSTTCAARTPTTSARRCSRPSAARCAWRPKPTRAPGRQRAVHQGSALGPSRRPAEH